MPFKKKKNTVKTKQSNVLTEYHLTNWTNYGYNLPSYFDICDFFFAGVWEGGVSFSNTAQFATLLRNKGASTEVSGKQMEHCLTNVSVNRMCRSIRMF